MTDPRDQLQASLGSAYTLERELGGGGMSRTYLATEKSLARRVVVKVLAPELLAGISVDRFKREVLMAAQLQHLHVVPVLASGDADGLPWVTMPYVEGESLRTRMPRGPLRISEIIGILKDVARALEFAHGQGRGDTAKAESHYARFIELWKDADPELQPKVREIRERLARSRRRQG